MEKTESESGNGRRVVVIGGGVAGSLASKVLQFDSDLTLIDPKEYFEITWASLRSMVEPSFAERSVINHKKYLQKWSYCVTSPAVNITETEVVTKDGLVFGYDYLVIATGHNDVLPKTRQEKLSQYQAGRFRAVCKQWNTLIIEDRFLVKHYSGEHHFIIRAGCSTITSMGFKNNTPIVLQNLTLGRAHPHKIF